jgi:hypothetical protein
MVLVGLLMWHACMLRELTSGELLYRSYRYVYICAYVYKSLDCSSYVAIRSEFRVSNWFSDIRGFGFGHEFSPESVFGSVSGFKFLFRFWVPRHSTRSEPDPLPSLRVVNHVALSIYCLFSKQKRSI